MRTSLTPRRIVGIAASLLCFAGATHVAEARAERAGAAQAESLVAAQGEAPLRAECEALATRIASNARDAAGLVETAASLIPDAADAGEASGEGWGVFVAGATQLARDGVVAAEDATRASQSAAQCAGTDAANASALAAGQALAQAREAGAAAEGKAANFSQARSANAGGSSQASDARLRAATVSLSIAQKLYAALTRNIHLDQNRIDAILSSIIR
jgi:hypothetical protein